MLRKGVVFVVVLCFYLEPKNGSYNAKYKVTWINIPKSKIIIREDKIDTSNKETLKNINKLQFIRYYKLLI